MNGPADIAEFHDPRLVAIYESVNAYDADAQPGFYCRLAAELGATTIVDLGCGTGLITRELARRGYHVIGIDPSPLMLEVARHGLDGDRVRWIEGDATQLDAESADLAFMSGHVAQFFLSDEAWHDALVALRRALRPGGVVAFETRNPAARGWERWTRAAAFTVTDPVAGPIECWSEVHDVIDGVVTYTNHYRFTAAGEELVSPSALRFRTPEALQRSMTEAGFAVEHLYGDWDRRPAGPTVPELIVVARAEASAPGSRRRHQPLGSEGSVISPETWKPMRS